MASGWLVSLLCGFLAVTGLAAGSGPAAAQGRPPDLAAMAVQERQDFGVPVPRGLHAGPMHGPTPSSLPGGQLITTQGLVALLQGRQVPYLLIDVLGQGETLPGAVVAPGFAQPGSLDDPVQAQASAWLMQRTQGRRDVALVFYCLSSECWLSWNAAVRAVGAGFANVLWYRGGLQAWKSAGLPTAMAQGQMATPGPMSSPMAGAGTGFTPVQPQPARAMAPAGPPASLSIQRGRFFQYAMPEGWQVGEEGQFAVSLVSPDQHAVTVLVGNAGLPVGTQADRFVASKLQAVRAQGLQLGPGRPSQPVQGFAQAVEFDIAYRTPAGVPMRGLAKVSANRGYDALVMAMTAAMAPEPEWPGYATWLPKVAESASALNGAAFGVRGIMQQNLENSRAFGEALRDYRAWSQRTWDQVTAARGASIDRRNFEFRQNLGAVQTWTNPYGGTPPMALSTQYGHYWINRQGQVVGTNDPSADPNAGSTGDWRRMERHQP